MSIVQVHSKDEIKLRRALLSLDYELAMHRQLKDYFLADTPQFGVMSHDNMAGLMLFSNYDGVFYVHHIYGADTSVQPFLDYIGAGPAQAFVRPHQVEAAGWIARGWSSVLTVTAGMVVPHRAYEGVFSRVAPRFDGSVYEIGIKVND